jgi:hypothetical protein
MKWLFAALLLLQAHFAASYLVPWSIGDDRLMTPVLARMLGRRLEEACRYTNMGGLSRGTLVT